MLIERALFTQSLLGALKKAPAVVLLGPRQVGKTTLARQIAQATNALYLDLERATDLRRLADPGAFLASNNQRITVFDEIQRVPELFAELRAAIDDRRMQGQRFGQFLLLGSASLKLMQQSTESLAGRVIYMEHAPIQLQEASAAHIDITRLWLRGGFPDSLLAATDQDSLLWRTNFLRSYIERDIPSFAPTLSTGLADRLWTMLANDQGNLLNASRLAKSLGVSAPTVNRYIDLLVELLMLRKLAPWSGNLNKRLVKSPKMYLRDSGLLHALTSIETIHQLKGQSLCGLSWEGFVIEQLINAANKRYKPFFYRSADGAEIDLLLEKGGKPSVAIEIKLSSAPTLERGFHTACEDLHIEHRILVAPVTEGYVSKYGVRIMPLADALNFVSQ